MVDPELIVNAIELMPFSKLIINKTILISLGGTRESIDEVRYISNLSSGKMGLSLAKKACFMGAEVDLVIGPNAS